VSVRVADRELAAVEVAAVGEDEVVVAAAASGRTSAFLPVR
jgi:hypothetical protein